MKIKTAITTTAATLLLSSLNVHAGETRLVSASDSPAAAVCIAAVESRTAARQAALELGIYDVDLSGLVCNDMPVSDFIAEYRDVSATRAATPGTVALNAGDQNPATQLCLAAITSPERFEEIRERHFSAYSEVELQETVRCNNRPLGRFVNEFRNRQLTASL